MKRIRFLSRHRPAAVETVETPAAVEASEAATTAGGRRSGRRVRRTVRFAVVVVVLVVGSFAAAAVAFALYDTYGVHPDKTAASWAAHPIQYAGSAMCVRCHAEEYAQEQASNHQTVACESCHGPLADHAAAQPPTAVEISSATEQCATCHVAVTGRAATFPQIQVTTHYGIGSCLRCHGAHSVVAVAPPLVPHPLDRLPACTTCHKPEGLKSIPAGHVQAPDAVCLSCHKVEAAGE